MKAWSWVADCVYCAVLRRGWLNPCLRCWGTYCREGCHVVRATAAERRTAVAYPEGEIADPWPCKHQTRAQFEAEMAEELDRHYREDYGQW